MSLELEHAGSSAGSKSPGDGTMASAAADRLAIERWEDEGGRALVLQVPLSAHPGELPAADAEDSISVGL